MMEKNIILFSTPHHHYPAPSPHYYEHYYCYSSHLSSSTL
jgi:hypothetical protein